MSKQIILCGAGKVGKKIFEKLGVDVVFCFADNHKAGETFNGKAVISLTELQKIANDFEVLLSVGSLWADELSAQLDGLGIRYTRYIDNVSYFRQFLLTRNDFEAIESEGIFTRAFAAFCKTIKPHTFVNIGAARGGYASIAAYFMPKDAQIYVFEPIVRYSSLLEKIFADDRRVEVVKKAVSNQTGKLDLFATVKPGTSGIAHSFTFDKEQTMFKDEYSEEGETLVETVDTITLDAFFADSNIDLMLMDIEGAELLAIDGMKKLIAKGKTAFFLELHEPYIKVLRPDGMEYISQAFTKNGYKLYWCAYEADNYTGTRGGTRIVPVPRLQFEHCIIVPESFTVFDTLLEKL